MIKPESPFSVAVPWDSIASEVDYKAKERRPRKSQRLRKKKGKYEKPQMKAARCKAHKLGELLQGGIHRFADDVADS